MRDGPTKLRELLRNGWFSCGGGGAGARSYVLHTRLRPSAQITADGLDTLMAVLPPPGHVSDFTTTPRTLAGHLQVPLVGCGKCANPDPNTPRGTTDTNTPRGTVSFAAGTIVCLRREVCHPPPLPHSPA